MAVFVKAADSPQLMHFVPLWMPLWTLTSFGGSCIGILGYLFRSPLELSMDSRLDLFWSGILHNFSYVSGYLLAAILMSWFAHEKVHLHRRMLTQMGDFDIRKAHCALETDRSFIERHVKALFDEAYEAPLSVAFGADEAPAQAPLISRSSLEEVRHVTSYPEPHEILEEFNNYVRGRMRESVIDRLGSEVDISFKLAVVGALPLVFIAPLYACEGYQCEDYAAHLGTKSVTLLMLTICLLNVLVVPGLTAWLFAAVLKAIPHVARITGSLQRPAVLVTGGILQLLVGLETACIFSIPYLLFAKYSHWLLASLLASVVFVGWQLWLVFKKPTTSGRRSLWVSWGP